MRQADLSSLGRAIRRRREGLDLRQHELASKAGVSASQLGKIERGTADPRASTLEKLARALDLTYGGLARLAEDEHARG